MISFLTVLILIFSPLVIAGLIASPLFKNNEVVIRRFAKSFSVLHFFYTALIIGFYTKTSSLDETVFSANWINVLGINFSFGLDELTLCLVGLTSFIFMIALILSKLNIRNKHKLYYSMMFLLETAVLGVFCARDIFMFFLFWELELIPMYFLISQWGDTNSKKSAFKFILYTFIGSLFMLVGLLLLNYYNFSESGILSGDMATIAQNSGAFPMPVLISILLLIGFGVKMPIFPLHPWLPDVHTDAVTPVSIILAAILLKLGAYGIIRFNFQMLPDAFVIIAPFLCILALINIIYGGILAYSQTDIKRIIAYSSISNMGLILLGICALNNVGMTGGIFHIVGHALIVTGLFTVAGIIYLRTKTRDMTALCGLAKHMPVLFGFATIIVFAGAGLPAFAGFIGELLSIMGLLISDYLLWIKIIAVISITIMIWATCYLLKFLHNTFYTRENSENCLVFDKIRDITRHEFLILFLITVVLLGLGLYPDSLISFIKDGTIFETLKHCNF